MYLWYPPSCRTVKFIEVRPACETMAFVHPPPWRANGRASPIARVSPGFCLSSGAASHGRCCRRNWVRVGDDVPASRARLATGGRVGWCPLVA